jgi:hypothetical protein
VRPSSAKKRKGDKKEKKEKEEGQERKEAIYNGEGKTTYNLD